MSGSPRERQDLVRITYWACNVLGHRHRNEISAYSCIVKRKGEPGELKKILRNVAMLEALVLGEPLVTIAKTYHCSDSNITKAVNSSLTKARRRAEAGGGCPYPERTWKRADFADPRLRHELEFFKSILLEMEVTLKKVVET